MITVLATARHGQGYVQEIGKFDDLDDIEIRVGMFDKDVVITFSEINEEKE